MLSKVNLNPLINPKTNFLTQLGTFNPKKFCQPFFKKLLGPKIKKK